MSLFFTYNIYCLELYFKIFNPVVCVGVERHCSKIDSKIFHSFMYPAKKHIGAVHQELL